MNWKCLAAGLAAITLMSGCEEPEGIEIPVALEVSDEAIGHYCGMLLVNHEGPKGQIHVEGREAPYWFSSVRDAIAFTKLPEEPKNISAIYVHDMGTATNWAHPEPGTWIDGREALYVIGSSRRGGMGSPEAVPFGDRAAAENFVMAYGGEIVAFGDIPDSYVLGSENDDQATPFGGMAEHGNGPGTGHDMSEIKNSGDHGSHDTSAPAAVHGSGK